MFGRPVIQVAYAVEDLASSVQWWAEQMGAGPFLVAEHIAVEHVMVASAPGTFDHSSAYGQWGEVMVELVQQHNPAKAPMPYAVRGLHHMATMVPDFDLEIERYESLGFSAAMTAEVAGSGTKFGFIDTRSALGHLIEIYPKSDALEGFYAQIREIAQGWDGTDPYRPLSL